MNDGAVRKIQLVLIKQADTKLEQKQLYIWHSTADDKNQTDSKPDCRL